MNCESFMWIVVHNRVGLIWIIFVTGMRPSQNSIYPKVYTIYSGYEKKKNKLLFLWGQLKNICSGSFLVFLVNLFVHKS